MRDRFKKFSDLTSDLTSLSKLDFSSAQEFVDKTITGAVDAGKATKQSLMSTAGIVTDSLQKNIDHEQVKTLIDSAKNIVGTGTEEVRKYTDRVMELTKENKAASPAEIGSAEEINNAIEKLKGKDKIGLAGEGLAVAGGAAAGVAASGTIASVAGASTLLGSTSLASTLGGVFVTATPVGWVVGSALVAGAAGYGITKLVRSGSRQDQIRKELIKRFQSRLEAMKKGELGQSTLDELRQLLPIVIDKGLVSEEQAERMIGLIERGKLDAENALRRIKSFSIQS